MRVVLKSVDGAGYRSDGFNALALLANHPRPTMQQSDRVSEVAYRAAQDRVWAVLYSCTDLSLIVISASLTERHCITLYSSDA